MPEGYTHVRTAKKAAEAIHYKIQCPAAFAAGANGPDSFFCFEIWKKRACPGPVFYFTECVRWSAGKDADN